MNNQQQPSNYDLLLGFFQTLDVLLNLNQVSNDTILEELQRQNKEYLTKIIEQNEEIIQQQSDIFKQINELRQTQEDILFNQQTNLEHIVADNQSLHSKVNEIVDTQIDLSDAILGRGSYYLKHIQKKYRGG